MQETIIVRIGKENCNETGHAKNMQSMIVYYYTPSETFNPSMLKPKWGEVDNDFWASCSSAKRCL